MPEQAWNERAVPCQQTSPCCPGDRASPDGKLMSCAPLSTAPCACWRVTQKPLLKCWEARADRLPCYAAAPDQIRFCWLKYQCCKARI